MAIKRKGNEADLNLYFAKLKAQLDVAIVLRLSKLGEDLVKHARSVPPEIGFKDRTGNLRNSIGYIVAIRGNIVKSVFSSLKNGGKGENTGIKYAESLVSNYVDGAVLIVVAGMEYALAVESRGRDVLTSAEYKAQERTPIEMENLKKVISNLKI